MFRLPVSKWLNQYSRQDLTQDALAAIIVTLMLIPQSLAYALIAGLPAIYGLYASILPLVAYTLLGTSRTLSVGPAAVLSLMTIAALSPMATPGSERYIQLASLLALLSGVILLVMAFLRLGFLVNFLSHPVLAGFVSGSAILIIVSQLGNLLGINSSGSTLIELISHLGAHLSNFNPATTALGIGACVLLLFSRYGLSPLLRRIGVPQAMITHLVRLMPALVVLAAVALVAAFNLQQQGVATVGALQASLPSFGMPQWTLNDLKLLLPSALLIALVGMVESISIAQSMAAKAREHIEPNHELTALGGANIASAISMGFPVTGSFSRSAVNADAGARTPVAGSFTALGIVLALLLLTPLFAYLPTTVLAATIIIAVMNMVDFRAFWRWWAFSKSDATAFAITLLGVLFIGVETGLIVGVLYSLALFLYKTSRPHIAELGLLSGTEHFRNVKRYEVERHEAVLSIRIDESLYFANARYLEDTISELTSARPNLKHVVLMCSGINGVDASALESLETIHYRLQEAGITLHLSEVKGPVRDRLERTRFWHELSGQVFTSQYQAYKSLSDVQ